MYLNFWALHASAKIVTKRLQLAHHSCTSGLLVVSQSCNDDWFKTWQVEDSSTKLWRFNDNLDWWQIKANAACCCPHLSSSSSSSSSSWASRCWQPQATPFFNLSSFNSPPPKTQTKTKKTKNNNNSSNNNSNNNNTFSNINKFWSFLCRQEESHESKKNKRPEEVSRSPSTLLTHGTQQNSNSK